MNDINNLPHLDPCPFCGGRASICYPYAPYTQEMVEYMASCKSIVKLGSLLGGCWVNCDCGAELGRGGWDSQENDNGNYETFEDAAAAWNSRK